MPRPTPTTLRKFVLARFRSRRTTRLTGDQSSSNSNSKNKNDSNIYSHCHIFLASDELNHLLSNLPADKIAWESALTTALALQETAWENLQNVFDNMNDEYNVDDTTAMYTSLWRTTRFLLQGAYYLQQGLALDQMPDVDVDVETQPAVGLVHPSVPLSVSERLVLLRLESGGGFLSALPQRKTREKVSFPLAACQQRLALEQMPDAGVETKVEVEIHPQDGSCSGHVLHAAVGLVHASVPLSVLERLIRDHPEQLLQPGPVHGRLPLHVAAIKGPAPVAAANCNGGGRGCSAMVGGGDLLELLVEACPQAAARADDQGQYPLHLACQAGYTLESGLEALWRAAPDILCQYQYEKDVFDDNNSTSTGSIRKNAAAQKELLSSFSSRNMVHDALIQANTGTVIV